MYVCMYVQDNWIYSYKNQNEVKILQEINDPSVTYSYLYSVQYIQGKYNGYKKIWNEIKI